LAYFPAICALHFTVVYFVSTDIVTKVILVASMYWDGWRFVAL